AFSRWTSPRRTAASRQSALRAPRGGGGDSFGFVALSRPNSYAGWWHQSDIPAFVRRRGTSGQDRRHAAHFHGFRVPQRGMTTLTNLPHTSASPLGKFALDF